MARIEIWAIDHRVEGHQPEGKIIKPWVLLSVERDGRYADFCALRGVWDKYQDDEPPEIIGFFTHRKYLLPPMERRPVLLVEPAHAPLWYQTSADQFNQYRQWWAKWDGAELLPWLASYDILQAAPFPLSGNIITDFGRSRSARDADALRDTLRKHGRSTNSYKIYSYIFITRWSVFDRMMRETEPLRKELHEFCQAADSDNEEYKKRPMAYVMERVYSLWLEHSGLAIKEMPLLHCWEM